MGACVQKWDVSSGSLAPDSVILTSQLTPSIPEPVLTFVFTVALETNHSIEFTMQRDSDEGFCGCTSIQV